MNNVVRIVHEKGLTIQKDIFGLWRFRSAVGSEAHSPIDPNQIENIYGLRQVLMIDLSPPQFPFPKELPYVLDTTGSGFLETQRWDFIQHGRLEGPYFHHILTLQYVVGSVIYHCRRLAEAYSTICFDYARLSPSQDSIASSQNESDAYYEFDALVTAARSTYEMTRYILWAAFSGQQRDTPRNFRDTLKQLGTCLPTDLATRINTSWSQFGQRLSDYRDSIRHKTPVDFGLSTALMERLSGGVWITSLPIPDNPEDKSKRKFRYAGKIDALTYGWEIANEIVDVASAIVNAIPQKAILPTREETVI